MGGLNENTKSNMKIESENRIFIDKQINKCIYRNMKYDIVLKIMEIVRNYREKVFELKMQAKDLNKMYEGVKMPKLNTMYNDDDSTIGMINSYYGSLIDAFETGIVEEKANKDNEQKEVDTDKEDVFELE